MKKLAIVLFSIIFIACKNTEIQEKREVIIQKDKTTVTTKRREVDIKDKSDYIEKIYTAPKSKKIVIVEEMPYVEYIF